LKPAPSRTLLLFAYECAPHHQLESTAGAQRPAQFAKWLVRFGWRTVVLCCEARQRRTLEDQALAAVAQEARDAIRQAGREGFAVIATPSLRWDGMLDRAWCALRGRQAGLALLSRRALTAAMLVRGDASRSWQPVARAAARAIVAERPVDACLGEHSPDAGVFLARWFADTYGVPWLVDFRDPPLRSLRPAARRVYGTVMRRTVRTAAATIAVNPRWAREDERLLGRPAVSIPNGFDPDEFTGPPPPRDDARLVIAYLGQVIPSQRLDVFLSGVALLKAELGDGLSRRFVFRYRGVSHGEVGRLAAQAGIGALVDMGSPIPRPAAIAQMRAADLLLLLSATGGAVDFGIEEGLYPAKTFEYFGARRPILCVPGDGGLLDALLAATETGSVCARPEDVARFLREALTHHESGRPQPYRPQEERVDEYSRARQAQQLAEVLDRIAVVGSRS
jgi:glycosyltransferase involved in cell wall biosynthesis